MENVIENNKLIAEFMGGKMVVEDHHGINIIKMPDGKDHDLSGLKYHKSWDALMPVVERIEGLLSAYSNFTINRKALVEYNNVKFECEEGSKLENTYQAITEFIIWYNSQQKQKLI